MRFEKLPKAGTTEKKAEFNSPHLLRLMYSELAMPSGSLSEYFVCSGNLAPCICPYTLYQEHAL